MQESNILNQNGRKVAVKVLVKDDIPLFLQQQQQAQQKTNYQKNYCYNDNKDYFIYEQYNKQKYNTKAIHDSMLNLCQQYNNSMQLLPYFNYYHPSLIATIANQDDENHSEQK